MAGELEAAQAVGGIFIGIGGMVVLFVMAYMFYQISRLFKPMADKEWKYELYEEMVLDKVAKKKGIDLEKEYMKREIRRKKTLRRRLEEEMIEEMFGKEKEDK